MGNRILFVCSGNTERSPTTEDLIRPIKGIEVRSAGTIQSAPTKLSKELIDWAEIIFAMEDIHKQDIATKFTCRKICKK